MIECFATVHSHIRIFRFIDLSLPDTQIEEKPKDGKGCIKTVMVEVLRMKVINEVYFR